MAVGVEVLEMSAPQIAFAADDAPKTADYWW
jgi:hypothetical protein